VTKFGEIVNEDALGMYCTLNPRSPLKAFTDLKVHID